MPTNLNDYYAGKGAALPSLAVRGSAYQSFGLGDAASYTGTAQQNTALLGKLTASGTQTVIPAPATPTGTPTPGAANPLPGQTQAGITPPTQPAVTPIPPTLTPPTTGSGTPTLPPAQAPTLADQFNTSLSSTVTNSQKQLQDSLTQQQSQYQSKIDALNQEKQNFTDLQQSGLATMHDITNNEAQDKAAALEQERQQFQKNYEARQQLTDQLQTLLSRGQTIVEGLRNTSGLSSIMNGRISQTMADVQGQAGVITATLSAYSDQIGLAQTQLKDATDAISSIYGDQLNYWKSVVDFYGGQQKDVEGQITKLSSDQQTYIDEQIKQLQANVTNTQATAKIIQDAMLDPTKALAYSKAGVSLTDTPAQISQKLATYEAAQQNVWGAPHLMGGDYIQTNKLTGETRTVVNNVAKPGPGGTPSGQDYSKGTMSAKQFVELSLQRAGLKYEDALSKVPAGKVGVVDNATGQIGSINPTEYNTKQYTYL
jgi:hypothetical protein